MTSVEEVPRPFSQARSRTPGTKTPLPQTDFGSEHENSNSNQRSVTVTNIQRPRMAQLETLEAKMASIEVSLSSTPRRKKNGSITGLNLGSSIRSLPREIATKELENLRNALRDKENVIQNLKGQLMNPNVRILNGVGSPANGNGSLSNARELSDNERQHAEDRLARLKNDVDNKRLAIKNLKMALERLDITDNIDVRIQQAELEYQLGREELNLLTLLEESRALQVCLEESNKNTVTTDTLFSCIFGNQPITLSAVEIDYDPKNPKFGAGPKDGNTGLYVDWALEESGLCKGDRIVEVNGRFVLTKGKDDLDRLLAAAPDPAQIVVLRRLSVANHVSVSLDYNKEVAALRSELEVVRDRAEEAQRAKNGFKSDNIRLTHRISYLEEQVAELLNRKSSESDIRIVTKAPVVPIVSTVKSNQNVTNINITSQSSAITNSNMNAQDVQVFQKGSQITTLVGKVESAKENHTSLPLRSKSSLSNVSNTHISLHSSSLDYSCNKSHKHKHKLKNGVNISQSTQALNQIIEKNGHKKHHHHHHRARDYNSETNSMSDQHHRNRKSQENGHRYSVEYILNENEKRSEALMDQSYHKATKIVQDLTRSREASLYEKHKQKCLMASEKYNADILKHYNARKSASILDFRSEAQIAEKYSDSKSVEHLNDLDKKTLVPKMFNKLQNSRSVKSLDFDSDTNSITCNSRLSLGPKSIDYTSEPLENNRKLSQYLFEQSKSRPLPPKKPVRLSLHKTQSLQSVDTHPNGNSGDLLINGDIRKILKRAHKGEVSKHQGFRIHEVNGRTNGSILPPPIHITNGNCHRIEGFENGLESGSWC